MTSRKEDAENNRPGPSNFENKHLRTKHASNKEIDKDKRQDSRFQPYDMNELRQRLTPLQYMNETLDDTIILIEYRPEANYHNKTRRHTFITENKTRFCDLNK